MIKGKDVDEVLYKACKELKDAPEYAPRGMKTKELLQETLIIENPKKCIITNPARKLSRTYIDKELEWYLSGEKTIDKIKDYASLWSKITNDKGEVNSNYGEMIFFQQLDNFDGSQWDWVIESLKKDKNSRQAIINFNQPKHKYNGVKDFPCTETVQYVIRDNKLIGITNMRSNDLVYGFGNDFPFFSYIQQKLLKELNNNELELGKNIHTAASLHTYEKHYKMLENIINEYEKLKINSSEL